MKLYLVNPSNDDGDGLDGEGFRQMKLVARRLILDRVSVDRVYANGRLVSAQSGDILSKALRAPLIRDERFVEFNIMQSSDFIVDTENLESIYAFVDELLMRGKDAIIIMGGGIHRAVISRLTGMSLADTRHFELMPSSISVVQYNKDITNGWRIQSINDTTHLLVP